MSVKSKKSAKAIDRPFDADVMAKAKAIAQEYQVILACEDGHWYGRGLEMPRVFGDGKTANQCIENTREALTAAVAYLLEEGQRPPTPATDGTANHAGQRPFDGRGKGPVGSDGETEGL